MPVFILVSTQILSASYTQETSSYELTLSLPRVLSSKLIEEKIMNFVLHYCQKQTAPHESTAQ